MKKWSHYLPLRWQEKVTLTMNANFLELFLRKVYQQGWSIFQLQYGQNDHILFQMLASDVLPFFHWARQQKIRVKMVQRSGFLWVGRHLWKRKILGLGAVGACGILWLLSSLVWQVNIVGTDAINQQRVRALLFREGVYVGQWQSHLPNFDQLLQRLQSQLPEAAWIGIQQQGVALTIDVVEKKKVIPTPNGEGLTDTKGNIVAKRGALVTEVLVERGNPLVDVQDVVTAGQILIAGFYGDPQQPSGAVWVGARGRVLGEVWYAAEVEVPLRSHHFIYTGRKKTEIFPYVSLQILRLPGFTLPYPEQRIRKRVRAVRLGMWELPIGWVEEEYWEVVPQIFQRSIPAAVELGRQQARAKILKELGSTGKILAEKILHQRQERGKVVLSVHFAAVENIAVSQSEQQGE